jgi:6,7-dimethyl-8-ribityllumazine synthase
MSGEGAPQLDVQDARGLKVAVIASLWHERIMGGLIDGAQKALKEYGVEDAVVLRVPGSFELPVVAKGLAVNGYDAVVALGVVIRGGTPHFEYVCEAATLGLTQVSTDTGVPVGFGVLTCDDEQQGLDRAGLPGSKEDKGYEATSAALNTALLLRGIAGK